jgi:tetratricopeptide (TPR) repeat protein
MAHITKILMLISLILSCTVINVQAQKKNAASQPATMNSIDVPVPNDSALAQFKYGTSKMEAGAYGEAIMHFNKALEFEPAYPAALISRGNAKKQLLDYKSAVDDYNTVLKYKLNWEESYEVHFNKGLALAALENLRGAMADFNYTLKLNPEHADAYYNRSIIRGRFGDYPGELADINKAISLKPNDPEAHNSRGIARSMLGDYDGAIEDFTTAITLNDTNSSAYFNRALVLYEMKKYHASENDFSKALELKKDAETYNRRANAKCRLGDNKGAFADYEMALKTDTAYYIAYLNRGMLHMDLKDYKAAVGDFTAALKIKPDYSIAYYNRGLAKGKLNDFKGEIEDYSFAIEYKPDYENAYTDRGLARYVSGDKAGGCKDLNYAVRLGSDRAYNSLIEYCK